MGNFAGIGRARADALPGNPKGRTKQHMKDECDINRILTRFRITGQISHLAQGLPVYTDVSELTDFRDSIHRVQAATEFFGKLNSTTRYAFDNDPVAFLDFVIKTQHGDPNAIALGEKIGIIKKTTEKTDNKPPTTEPTTNT